ncbi:MAG: transglutaminase family protein [Verrucomicrobia bacterium]|nr:transglutaminase family protein [Verrucomicrobiota bacterium]
MKISRFVSGYMLSGISDVGRGSTHAWAEIYLPEHGWIGYGPLIGRRGGPGHIAVGGSFHPRGVMPVCGGFMGLSGIGTSLKVGIARCAPSRRFSTSCYSGKPQHGNHSKSVEGE